jgi:hypothetical protein
MSDIDDSFVPGVLYDPLTGFEDLRDILDPVTGRLMSRHSPLSPPVLGMTIEEASKSAEAWWERTGRRGMPDYNKPADYLNSYGIKSGILLGLPWASLNLGERVRVVKIWHGSIGVYTRGMGITTEKDLKNVLEQEARANRVRSFDIAAALGGRDTKARH